MSAENTDNQAGGSDPATGNDAAGAATNEIASGPASGASNGHTPAALVTLTTGQPVPHPDSDAHAEHVESMHAALKNIAKDFKALGVDFETAAKNAWEAEV